jgi:hypothetical protein
LSLPRLASHPWLQSVFAAVACGFHVSYFDVSAALPVSKKSPLAHLLPARRLTPDSPGTTLNPVHEIRI